MPRRGLTVTFAFQFRPCSLSPILSYFSHVSAFNSYHVSSFCSFLSTTISAIVLVPAHYSPHSFHRCGASFPFKCNVPAQLIHRQGDWQSDAYLAYLNMSLEQKQLAVTTMADDISGYLPFDISLSTLISQWHHSILFFFSSSYYSYNHAFSKLHNLGLGLWRESIDSVTGVIRYSVFLLSNLTQ